MAVLIFNEHTKLMQKPKTFQYALIWEQCIWLPDLSYISYIPSDLNVRLCDVGLKVILARKKEKTKNTIQ